VWQKRLSRFAEAERLNPAFGLEYRALAAVNHFLDVPREELEELRDSLVGWDAEAVPDSTSPLAQTRTRNLLVHDGFHAHIRVYLLGVLHARLDDYAAAYALAEELENLKGPPDAGTVAQDLAHGIRGHIAWSRGLPSEALDELNKARREGPWLEGRFWWSSPFLYQSYEHLVTALALQELGRNDEALAWYDSIFSGLNDFNFIYQAPVHFKRAEIYESLGQPERAVEHYRRFIELLKNCDPPLRPRVEEAKRRLDTLSMRNSK
jgi:tetratricopeptide (TPR) repeat protein